MAKPAKYGQKTGAGTENTASVSAGAGIWASIAQKVVSHNDHLKRDFYNQYDHRPATSKSFSRRVGASRTAGETPSKHSTYRRQFPFGFLAGRFLLPEGEKLVALKQ